MSSPSPADAAPAFTWLECHICGTKTAWHGKYCSAVGGAFNRAQLEINRVSALLTASETARAAAEERVKELEREAEHHVAMRKRCSDDNVALSRLRNAAEAQAARLREAATRLRLYIEKRPGDYDARFYFVLRAHEDAGAAVLALDAALTPPSQEGDGRALLPPTPKGGD